MVYISARREVNTHGIVAECLRIGKKIAVPRVVPDSGILEPREITQWSPNLEQNPQIEKGSYGLWEPRVNATRAIAIQELDCVLVPGVAFDANGQRLGRGKGYYDRFLAQLSPDVPLISLAYRDQIVASIPFEAHDIPVHEVLTSD